MSLDNLCIWKGVIGRDRVLYGRLGEANESLACERCDGYDESCQAYLETYLHEKGLKLQKRK